MKTACQPHNEQERLYSLYMADLLDSADDERFIRLTRLAKRLFDVPVVLISLLDSERQWMLACQGMDARETPRDVSFCGHAILQEGPFIVQDTLFDERFHDNPLVTGDPFIRFYAGYPVHLPDGAVAGTFCLIDTKPRVFREADIVSLQDLAYIVEDEFQVMEMAMTDALTGISNRRGFYRAGDKRFRSALNEKKPLAIIYFDLDGFKRINDLWGHREGDEVLKTFSMLMTRQLGPRDIAGRIGGDEFAVILADKNSGEQFMERLRISIFSLNQAAVKPYQIMYTCGMLISDQKPYSSLLALIEDCDEVMYLKKNKKRRIERNNFNV